MALSTQPYKGARDFYPEDKQLQNYIFSVLRQVASRYGYLEYDAPIIESLDLYRAKTGEEIVNNQIYNFKDRGEREVALRPEMTPSVSRMVAARRQELAYPARWFSIPNLWRYERPQRGRLREHWQLNIDIFGDAGVSADHEVISVADSVLKAFGATPTMYKIKLNSRKLTDALLKSYIGLNEERAAKFMKLLDRMNKTEPEQFSKDLEGIYSDLLDDVPSKIDTFLSIKTFADLPDEFHDHQSVQALRSIIDLLEEGGITNLEFDISLMRGFDYYTDIVFEVFDTHPENNRSMFGGGRYDGLVGLFGVEPLPTVGFGMGDVTLANFLQAHDLLPKLETPVDVLMVLIGDVYKEAFRIADKLREMELNVSVDATDRKLDKKLKSADKHGIRYVMFVGEQELDDEIYSLKDLVTGKEEKHSAERIVSIIRDYRS